jgi:hypothetical protein
MMLCANESHFINGAVMSADDGFARERGVTCVR